MDFYPEKVGSANLHFNSQTLQSSFYKYFHVLSWQEGMPSLYLTRNNDYAMSGLTMDKRNDTVDSQTKVFKCHTNNMSLYRRGPETCHKVHLRSECVG